MKSARYESVPSVHPLPLANVLFSFFLSCLTFFLFPCFFALLICFLTFGSLNVLLILTNSFLRTTMPGGTPPPADVDTGTCMTWPYGLPSGEFRIWPGSTIGTLAVNMYTRSDGLPPTGVPLNSSEVPGAEMPSAVAKPVPTRDLLHAALAASGGWPVIAAGLHCGSPFPSRVNSSGRWTSTVCSDGGGPAPER
jgi:hypothetical protein